MKTPITFLAFCLFLFLAYTSISQTIDDGNRDNIWLFGYGSFSMYDGFGRIVIDFNPVVPTIHREDREMQFNVTYGSICDTLGNLLFYSNGLYIANAEHGHMENGDDINPGPWTSSYPSGLPIPQGLLILPMPGSSSKYMLLHGLLDFPPMTGPVYSHLYYSIIDMGLDNGLGVVVEKNVKIMEDTLVAGKITAVRHGNGRDWWVIVPENSTNRYYTLLLTPGGLQNLGPQTVGTPVMKGLGQAVFSPDGSKYLRYDIHSADIGNYLNFYDFDRCEGLLSNQLELHIADSAGAAGLAVSPSSRFAYFPSARRIYQYDLWADDIAASKETVAVFDGFVSPWPLPTGFFLAQLAPDGKIYINTPSGSNRLHVIHDPDEKGQACNLEQHGILLPGRNAFTMPNFPSFRLGPLDGSPCDTLGLDNFPIAKFRYGQTSGSDFFTAKFRDLSYYEPAAWHWDFGDGGSSQDTSPVHIYAQPGTYTVCLTVENGFGTSIPYCIDVTVPFAPLAMADFAFTANNLTVEFTDISAENPTAWTWDLGFGGSQAISNDQNPTHTYDEYGTYTVCLSVSNSDALGHSTTTCKEVVLADVPPVAGFTYTVDGFDVVFTDTSSDGPTSWAWDFGDGSISSEQNPQHIYAGNGTYPVCLTVANSFGPDQTCHELVVFIDADYEVFEHGHLSVMPNPFQERLDIALDGHLPGNFSINLFNSLGSLVLSQPLHNGLNFLPTTALSSGLYFYEINGNGKKVKNGKLVKL